MLCCLAMVSIWLDLEWTSRINFLIPKISRLAVNNTKRARFCWDVKTKFEIRNPKKVIVHEIVNCFVRLMVRCRRRLSVVWRCECMCSDLLDSFFVFLLRLKSVFHQLDYFLFLPPQTRDTSLCRFFLLISVHGDVEGQLCHLFAAFNVKEKNR